MARRDGAELAEPSLPRQRLLRRRAAPRSAARAGEGAPGEGDRAPRPRGGGRLRCPAEGITGGH